MILLKLKNQEWECAKYDGGLKILTHLNSLHWQGKALPEIVEVPVEMVDAGVPAKAVKGRLEAGKARS